MLGHILYNIFLSDIFLILNGVGTAGYVDDSILYKSCTNIDAVVKTLRMSAEKLFKWFKDIQMKDHTDQWNLILSTGDSNKIQIGNSKIRRSFCEELYCFKFVHKLPTDEHVKSSCKNAHVKLNVGRVVL